LTPREEKILRARYGFGQEGPMTLDAIGKKYHISLERVRQIQEKALTKLRNLSCIENIKSFFIGN